jgi:ribosomal protein S18 acetylase RimI-like enzyme
MLYVRPTQPEDFAAVLGLLAQQWPGRALNTESLQRVFDRALDSESQLYICAVNEERVVGFASLTIKNNLWEQGYLAHIDELVVDHQYRGRRVGATMFQRLTELARQKGCSRLELDSAFNSERAHRFYKRHGFESRGIVFSKNLE